MNEAEAKSAVVSVLSKILGRSEADILADETAYAAYHWDDGFLDAYGDEVDWSTGEFEGPDETEYPGWARADFDPERTLVYDESFDPGVLDEGPLKDFSEAHQGHLYLPQVAELVRTGHIQLEYPMVYGRVRAPSTNLVDVATRLFGLHQPLWAFDEDHYEVDPLWQDTIAAIEPDELRYHIGVLFQTAQTARSFGAYFEGNDSDSWEYLQTIEPIACWQVGEGQGHFCIAKLLDDTVAPVPDLGEPVAQPTTSDELLELFEEANSGTRAERLPHLDALLDRFDELDFDRQNNIMTQLGNPWSGAVAMDAVRVLEKAAALDTEKFGHFRYMLFFQAAYAADVAGEPEMAIDLYSKSLELKPDWAMAWYNRACEHGLVGNTPEAVSDLRRAIELDLRWAAASEDESYFDPVRESPEFKALAEEVGMNDE